MTPSDIPREKPVLIPHPINSLLSGISDIGKLHQAHGIIIEEGAATKDWQTDRSSIYTRSGIALLCACWEAFVEDCAEHALKFLILNAKNSSQLPLKLRKKIAKEVQADKDELAAWNLAEDGWRETLIQRFDSVAKTRINLMNSPKTNNVNSLYLDLLGVDDISSCWHWDGYSNEIVCKRLNEFVSARGAIAHGREPETDIGCFSLMFFTQFIAECSHRTSNRIREHFSDVLDVEIWPEMTTGADWKRFSDLAESLPEVEHVMLFRGADMDAHYATFEKDDEQIAAGQSTTAE